MKFFIPFVVESVQAERVYARIADRLNSLGYEVITNERIYKVIFMREHKLTSETVGAATNNGEVVIAIFKNHVGYFICTYSHGVVWGDPMVARYAMVQSAEFFNETNDQEKSETDHTVAS
jgi:hypothetical protein